MKKVKATDCSLWSSCDAPICPLDEVSLRTGIWYPDESICRKHLHNWIQHQKKIAKKAKNKEKYFTFDMLKRDCIIGNGIEGLDPHSEEAPQLEKWFEKHPIISAERRRANKEKGRALAANYTIRKRSKNSNL